MGKGQEAMFKVIIAITADDAELWIQFNSKSFWEYPEDLFISNWRPWSLFWRSKS